MRTTLHWKAVSGTCSSHTETVVYLLTCCSICHREVKSDDGSQDGLSITEEDFDLLDLHPATLQYVRRITTESMFWDRRHEKLSECAPASVRVF